MRKTKTAICNRLAAVLIAVLFLCGGTGHGAQPPQTRKEYALIFGTVWTANNQPAYGIPIKIRRVNEKRARWEQVSDHRGEFAQRVPIGKQDYVIWADVKVGKGKAKPEAKVHVENDERVDVSVHLTE